MPIYEYQCKECGYKFEELVLGKKEVKCPKCHSNLLNKLISTTNIGKKSADNNCGCTACGL